MRSLGRGTILFVNGGSAVRPAGGVTGTSIVFADESTYAQMLHDELAVDRIHVAQLIIPGAIERGHPRKNPAVLSETLWGLHAERDGFRHLADSLDS
jgi:hypothetical protein